MTFKTLETVHSLRPNDLPSTPGWALKSRVGHVCVFCHHDLVIMVIITSSNTHPDWTTVSCDVTWYGLMSLTNTLKATRACPQSCHIWQAGITKVGQHVLNLSWFGWSGQRSNKADIWIRRMSSCDVMLHTSVCGAGYMYRWELHHTMGHLARKHVAPNIAFAARGAGHNISVVTNHAPLVLFHSDTTL